ncbi:MAG: hypothetical protein IKG03_02160 [Clostridiales bacterium]|nr:hypothetical protein [Clostridiales bacterium]
MKTSEGNTDKSGREAKSGKSRINFFLVFLICWLVVVTGFIAWFLLRFKDFAAAYEEKYQASLPYHTAEEITQHFNDHDVDYILSNMTSNTSVTAFEDASVVRTYVEDLIDGKSFVYVETDSSREDEPEYYIKTDDGFLVARFELTEDKSKNLPYGFKAWEKESLEFYTAASYSVNVSAPETYKVFVNGIELTEANLIGEVVPSELTQYVEPYAEIPGTANYQVKGLYMKPVVTAEDYLGNACDCVYDSENDSYSVGFIKDFEGREELEEFAISFTSTFANYISQDASNYALDKYFPSGSQALSYIKRNSSRELYTKHGSVSINNEEVKDCIVFSDDVVYMEVYVEQWMQMYWGSDEPEVIPTDAHVYFVKTNDRWVVGGIQY